jgi:sodium/hydrogen antiporter
VTSVVALVVSILLWIALSRRLTRWSLTAPILLTLCGFLAAHALHAETRLETDSIRELIELTLAVVLFVDASSIALNWFRDEWRFPARLLGIGLPLTIVLGVGVAVVMFPGHDVWLLAVIGAALAPTDAALGVSIIENERIPLWFRQVINVESGLNDGLVTPVVTFCIAIAAATLDQLADRPFASAAVEIVVGAALGLVVGAAAGRGLRVAVDRELALPGLVPIAPLVVVLATYLGAVAIGGNGFVAAFVCGVGFGTASRRQAARAPRLVDAHPADNESLLEFSHLTAQLLGFAVWFFFGESVLGSLGTAHLGQAVAYGLLSLTVLRMVPVALSLLGMRLPWDTVLLAGWLGPRGLASIIFAILATDAIGGADGEFVLSVVAVTVAMSVLAHGLSAGPLAAWYAGRHPVQEPAAQAASPGA